MHILELVDLLAMVISAILCIASGMDSHSKTQPIHKLGFDGIFHSMVFELYQYDNDCKVGRRIGT